MQNAGSVPDSISGASEGAIDPGVISWSPATRLITLLGDPVSHSLSPAFQNAAIRAAGLDGVYLALRCDGADVPGLIRGIARAGGGGNITVPHKEVAAETVESRTSAVERTGACNTFWLEDGRVCGDNTDLAGVRAAARALAGDLAGMRVLLIGAGGAARAALAVLLEDGVDSIQLLNRTPSRAAALLEEFPGTDRASIASGLEAVARERFDLVVNATSLGLRDDDPLPLPLDAIADFGAALDLVYSPGETRWVHAAREAGIPAADGIEMLLHQGAAAFERWWQMPAPIEAMRAALTAGASR